MTVRKITIVIIALYLLTHASLAQSGEALAYGDSVSGAIDANQSTPIHYFDAEAGDNINLRAEVFQEDFISLTIVDASGEVLAMGSSPLNNFSHIGTMTIPATGRYFVMLDMNKPSTYYISLTQREIQSIEIGTQERDFFSPYADYLDFAFEGQAGQNIIITANTDAFDPVMTVYAPDGLELAQDDDSGGNLNARIEFASLSQTGSYRIVVTPYGALNGNEIYVRVEEVPEPLLPYDETIEFQLTSDNSFQSVYFEGEAGDVINLIFDNPSEGVELNFRPDRDIVAYDDDPDQLGMTEIRLQADRIYEISFNLIPDATEGAVSLTLELVRQDAVSLDAIAIHISDKDPVRVLNFRGFDTSSGILTISRYDLPITQAQPIRVSLRQNGEVFASYLATDIEGFNHQDLQLSFRMDDGLVEVVIEYLGEGDYVFDLSVELRFGMG